jgi:hypothetical protein
MAACYWPYDRDSKEVVANEKKLPYRPPGPLSPATMKACENGPLPGPAPLRRLTRAQYNNTVRDLLGDGSNPAEQFPADQIEGDFTNNASSQTVTPILAESMTLAAERLAKQAASNLEKLMGCSVETLAQDDAACAKSFLESFGKRAFRRPLTRDELEGLQKLYQLGKQEHDDNVSPFQSGAGAVVEAVLQNASFLYQVEFGEAKKAVPSKDVVALSSYEMASRLSYLLWNSMPDDALFAAAERDELTTPEQIEAQTARMLGDSRAREGTGEFLAEWLKVSEMTSIVKDGATYAGFTKEVAQEMQGDTVAYANWALWDASGSLQTMLTSQTAFMTAKTAPFFGQNVPTGLAPGARFRVDGLSERSGLLTQPSVLSVFAKPNQSSPILRGKFVRERLLCTPIDPPPPELKVEPVELKPGIPTRDRFAQHSTDPACKGCHSLMDGIGFGFEAFDGVGRARTSDEGLPVNDFGELTASDTAGTFRGTRELGEKLAASNDVRNCVAKQYFRYASARGVVPGDACAIGMVQDAFNASGDLKSVLSALTRTDAFRFRSKLEGDKP